MLFLLCLLPLVAANPVPSTPTGYSLVIEDGILTGVKQSPDAQSQLDLSGMQLKNIERNAFDDLSKLKSLNLAENSLNELPEFMFANLSGLEELNLAGNKIMNFKNLFVGLENLKVLNISYNPVRYLRAGDLFGLPKSADILVEGNKLTSIYRFAFTSTFLKDEDEKEREKLREVEKVKEETKGVAKREVKMDEEAKSAGKLEENAKEDVKVPVPQEHKTKEENKLSVKEASNEKKTNVLDAARLKLCISDYVVTCLGILKENESLGEGCTQPKIVKKENKVDLHGLGIKGFEEGWYQLQSIPIERIDLSSNEITEITKELLNDLPAGLSYVNVAKNNIRNVWRDVLENEYLKDLNLNNNPIEVFEEGALGKTKLRAVYLMDVGLRNMNFVPSLPSTLEVLVLAGNELTSLPDGVFSHLTRLQYLNLNRNKIKSLQKEAFKGLESLRQLDLNDGRLEEIQADAFKGLRNVEQLYAHNNAIKNIEKGAFSGLDNLRMLFLGWNKIPKVTRDTFADLPSSLDELYLNDNEIESVDSGSFVQYPKLELSLTGNRLTSIPKGALNLPYLHELALTNNSIEAIDPDTFDGLPRLQILRLNSNKIAKISKGDCRNFGRLYNLDLSNNPFERLDNGALYGLRFSKGTSLSVHDNKLKVIQGGVFEDV